MSTGTPGLGCTSASMNYGTAGQVQATRQTSLDAAYSGHPERFRTRRPTTGTTKRGVDQRPQPGGSDAEHLDSPCLSSLTAPDHATLPAGTLLPGF